MGVVIPLCHLMKMHSAHSRAHILVRSTPSRSQRTHPCAQRFNQNEMSWSIMSYTLVAFTGAWPVQYDHEEIQDMLGRSFAVQDDIDEDELMGELDLIEDELALEVDTSATGVPNFLEEPDLPAVPTGHAADLLPEIQQPERPL